MAGETMAVDFCPASKISASETPDPAPSQADPRVSPGRQAHRGVSRRRRSAAYALEIMSPADTGAFQSAYDVFARTRDCPERSQYLVRGRSSTERSLPHQRLRLPRLGQTQGLDRRRPVL